MSTPVYPLGFWSNEKRDQHIRSYREQGFDERTSQLKTRADEMKELRRDPDYQQAAAEDRLAAQEAAWDRDRAEAGRAQGQDQQRQAPPMGGLVKALAGRMRQRQQEEGRGR